MPRSHKSLPRVFGTFELSQGAPVHLDKDQSNYIAAVLRMRTGEDVVLFNGRDGAWRSRITADAKKNVMLEAVEQIAPQSQRNDLWYGFAPLKSARLDYVVQKATEMGVGTIQPVITKYTQVHRIALDKLAANAVEAAEQCEVLNVPEIAPEVPLEKLVAEWGTVHGARRLIVADESAASSSPVETLRAIDGAPIGLLVGPEGGFSDEERTLLLAQDFVVPISLGPRILRADTAAVAALAVVQALIGDWR